MARRDSKDRSAMIVAAVAIILIIVMGITAGQRQNITAVEKWIGNIISPVQNVVNTGAGKISEGFRSVFSMGQIKRENEALLQQIETLQQEVIEYRLERDELEELRDLRYALNYHEEDTPMDIITADVIAKTPDSWFNIFTINVGENQGVTVDSIILSSNGLVGKVYEAGGSWSKVISIIDNNSSVSFQVLRDANSQGILSGSIDFEVSGYLFDPLAEVVVGDKLITSGLGNYPKGIPIGEVVEVGKTNDQLLKTVKVAPAVNFNRMSRVLVMTPKSVDE
ncbi:rod shape-determining protein MreC [Alkaliphilus crotonatoxidans]